MKSLDENLESYSLKQEKLTASQFVSNVLSFLIKPFVWLKDRPKLSVALLILLAGLFWWFSNGDNSTLAKPLLATVDRGDIEDAVTAAGNLQPSSYVDVGAQVSGQLEKLHVDVGDIVSEGQLLAEIDATVQINRVDASRASLRALEAQLSARKASLTLAQANADRQTRLIKEDATSQADFDQSMNTLASAQSSLIQLQSQIAQSKASLASDEATLSYSTIVAPTAGTVISINMVEGQTLNASQQTPTILRIADLTTMTVQGEVSEADVSKLSPGMEVYFTTLGGGDRRWYGTLRQILPKPEVSNNVVLYTALFDVENTDNSLLSDMTAQIFFVTASARNVIRVPVGALNFRDRSNLLALDIQDDTSVSTALVNNVTTETAGGSPETERPAGGGMGGGMGGNFADLTEEQIAELRARRQASGGEQRSSRTRDDGERTQRTTGSSDKATVIVANENGEFSRKEIAIGVTTRVSAEVLEGLVEGDRVIAGIIQANATTTTSTTSPINSTGTTRGGGGGGGRF